MHKIYHDFVLGGLIEYQGFLIESQKFDSFSLLFDCNYEDDNYENPEEEPKAKLTEQAKPASGKKS